MIYEKAYAKINLALEVKDIADGYHRVNNLMVPISLYDEIFLQKANDFILECTVDISDNICLKATKLFMEKYKIDSGVHIILNKNIPVMAGLAGGSSDAAATLRGLNRLFGVKASTEELCEIACKLGSDVPFFLYNKAALCTGRGEIINPLEGDFKNISFLLIKPKFGLSTKEVYNNYVYNGISKTATIERIIEACKLKDIKSLDDNIFNDLENVALKISPDLKILFNKISSLSYVPHVSGSGPSIYVLDAKQIDLENVKTLDESLSLFLCHTI